MLKFLIYIDSNQVWWHKFLLVIVWKIFRIFSVSASVSEEGYWYPQNDYAVVFKLGNEQTTLVEQYGTYTGKLQQQIRTTVAINPGNFDTRTKTKYFGHMYKPNIEIYLPCYSYFLLILRSHFRAVEKYRCCHCHSFPPILSLLNSRIVLSC